jgi:hypothetical protein
VSDGDIRRLPVAGWCCDGGSVGQVGGIFQIGFLRAGVIALDSFANEGASHTLSGL